MAVSMQNMMTITELEIELIKELEGKYDVIKKVELWKAYLYTLWNIR